MRIIDQESSVYLYHLETSPALFENLKESIHDRLHPFFNSAYYPAHRLNQSRLVRLFVWLIMGKRRKVYTSFEGKPCFSDQDISLSFTYTSQTIDLIISRTGPVAIDTMDETMADSMVGMEMVNLALGNFSAKEFAKRWTFLECAWKFLGKGLHQDFSFERACHFVTNSNVFIYYFRFLDQIISCVWLSKRALITVNIISEETLKHFLREQLT